MDTAAHPRLTRLGLFDGFTLQSQGHLMSLSPNSQRLIALVGLRGSVTREQASGTLWPDVPARRAAARLRTTLWRSHPTASKVLRSVKGQLVLQDDIQVDVREWLTLALSIIDQPDAASSVQLSAMRPCGELLPGWYDDWVLLERERLRQLQLHVLEIAADRHLRAGRHAAAIEMALGALQIEPTRESAHRIVIRIHLAEGNLGEARRQLQRCEQVLQQELGMPPSDQLRALLSPVPWSPPPPLDSRDAAR